MTKDNELSKKVISKILSKNFGETWSSYQDTEFISANQNFNKQIINNELTKYEYSIVHDALQKDLFRYDASEIMARPIGSNLFRIKIMQFCWINCKVYVLSFFYIRIWINSCNKFCLCS